LSDRLVFGYGSTETGLTAIGPANLVDGVPGAAGYKVPWADMQIVGEDHQPLPVGAIGRVRVRSDEMVTGYMDGDAISGAGSFHDGWFYPGDMGPIKADGLFVLEGRSDDVLNVGGVKISAWTVEEKLMDEAGVREAAACTLEIGGVPHLVAAVVGDADLAALGRIKLRAWRTWRHPRRAGGRRRRTRQPPAAASSRSHRGGPRPPRDCNAWAQGRAVALGKCRNLLARLGRCSSEMGQATDGTPLS
jgi:acyl-coenzyme A synthetase/AMP-(fatty) acid ligase